MCSFAGSIYLATFWENFKHTCTHNPNGTPKLHNPDTPSAPLTTSQKTKAIVSTLFLLMGVASLVLIGVGAADPFSAIHIIGMAGTGLFGSVLLTGVISISLKRRKAEKEDFTS